MNTEELEIKQLETKYFRLKEKDEKEAFAILVQLADKWPTYSYQVELADWYEHGRGTEKDEKKAFELVQYVYNHSSVSPYDRSQEDAAYALAYYLRNGIGCEKDPERATRIMQNLNDANDRLYEMLTR